MTRRKKRGNFGALMRIIFWAFIIYMLLWILYFSNYSFYKTHKVKQKMQSLEQELSVIQAQNDSLKEENRRLKTDPKAAEAVARERYGLTKENETNYRFFPSTPSKKDE